MCIQKLRFKMIYFKSLIIIFIFCYTLSANGQLIEKDLDREFLPDIQLTRKDTIKEIIIWKAKAYGKYMPRSKGNKYIEIKYNLYGNVSVYNQYDESENIHFSFHFKYNSKKKLTKVQKFDSQNRLMYQWFYDGKLVIEEYKYLINKDIEYAWFFTYDVFGNTTEEIKYNHFGKIVRRLSMVYDNYNKIVNISKFKMKGRFDYKWDITYDENNDTTECIKVNKNNIVQERIKYSYYKKGQLDSIVYFNNKGLPQWHKTFYFDPEGNLISWVFYDINEMKEYKYLYSYDMQSNLIERIYFIEFTQIDKKKYRYNKDNFLINEQKIVFMGITEEEHLVFETEYSYLKNGLPNEVAEKDYMNKNTVVTTYEYY